MPLTNRVDPFGGLFWSAARGMLMGNRGRIHKKDQTLGAPRFAHEHWICCVLDFNDRHRKVWGDSYTELFFLDEATALAAGHRPCFECRRKEAERFAALFSGGKTKRARAGAMDAVLHAERLDGNAKRLHRRMLDDLPDGAMIAIEGEPFAVRGKHLLRWSPQGYTGAQPRPRGMQADVLTPPSILNVLAGGYSPRWHPSATEIKP